MLRVNLDLSRKDMLKLTGIAHYEGYKRDDATKPWTMRELKDAARIAVASLIETRCKEDF